MTPLVWRTKAELTAHWTEVEEGTRKAMVEPEQPTTKVETEAWQSPLEPKK